VRRRRRRRRRRRWNSRSGIAASELERSRSCEVRKQRILSAALPRLRIPAECPRLGNAAATEQPGRVFCTLQGLPFDSRGNNRNIWGPPRPNCGTLRLLSRSLSASLSPPHSLTLSLSLSLSLVMPSHKSDSLLAQPAARDGGRRRALFVARLCTSLAPSLSLRTRAR
jgi:hypothetical protein